jgi:predicted transcriptional regulator
MAPTDLIERDPRRFAREIVDAAEDDPTWLDVFAETLDRRRSGEQLGRVLSVWDLTQSEVGRLFGVSRQAVSKWLRTGVPTDRIEVVADLAAATDLLVRYLKRDRIPAVVRREAPALGGRSLLDLVAEDRADEALAACREMFDVARVHA